MSTIILFGISFQTEKINQAACDLAKEVAREGGVYFAGCINQTAFLYSEGAGKDVVMKKFREQIEIFLQNNVDLIIAEVSCYLYTDKIKVDDDANDSCQCFDFSIGTCCNVHSFIIYRVIDGQNSFNLLYTIQDYQEGDKRRAPNKVI